MKLKVFPESWEHKHRQIDKYFWIFSSAFGGIICMHRQIALDEYLGMDRGITQTMHNTRL